MTLFNNKYRIESTRLKGWDYGSEGSYFVTICTEDRINLFGCVIEGKMELNQLPGKPVWQPRFHDHIIRDNDELNRIRHYIKNNPVKFIGD